MGMVNGGLEAWRVCVHGGLEAWKPGGLACVFACAWRLGVLCACVRVGLEAWRLGGLEAWCVRVCVRVC